MVLGKAPLRTMGFGGRTAAPQRREEAGSAGAEARLSQRNTTQAARSLDVSSSHIHSTPAKKRGHNNPRPVWSEPRCPERWRATAVSVKPMAEQASHSAALSAPERSPSGQKPQCRTAKLFLEGQGSTSSGNSIRIAGAGRGLPCGSQGPAAVPALRRQPHWRSGCEGDGPPSAARLTAEHRLKTSASDTAGLTGICVSSLSGA